MEADPATPCCSVCGGSEFFARQILWESLVAEWQLSPGERAYIDRQQGKVCTRCGSNLRSIALSNAILAAVGVAGTLLQYSVSPAAASLSLLEINEAGTLSPILARMRGHTLASYPGIDMHQMPYSENTYDMVVHSDTLEHLLQPVRALSECRRVLKPGGWLCFTIPTIVGRLTRSRTGLPKSFHGSPVTGSDDFMVHTEFGADMWTFVISAGFQDVKINTIGFPDATAISARK
jgi:SAM-dependent methyltransferase